MECKDRNEVCDTEFDPVCAWGKGVVKKTFSNSC